MFGKIKKFINIKYGHKRKIIAINMKPKDSPWGGGNQFVKQLESYLKSRGHKVVYKLDPAVSCILLIEPRPFESVQFGPREIGEFKKSHPHVRCIHRINECDKRKGTDNVDRLILDANEVADFTVFISNWLKDYFRERGFDPGRPNCVIHNGADPEIFYPLEDFEYLPESPFRIVTHHWSPNWMKGFKVYQEVDHMIANEELRGFSFTIIGRWPEGINWLSAITHPPVKGKRLARLLRQNHLYLTASLWEPCGMHHIEGAQCGLPLIYHEDGGGIVEFGKRYGIGFRDKVKDAILKARDQYPHLRKKVLEEAPSGLEMCQKYEEIISKCGEITG